MALYQSGSPIANVALSDTFNTWRNRTNQAVVDGVSTSANNTISGDNNIFTNDVDVRGVLTAADVTANTVSGNGSGLTTLNASNISTGTLASARLPDLAVSDFAGAAIQTGGEGFSDSDTVLMTAAAVDDRILSYGYSTTTGTVTSVTVTAGTGLSGGGTITSSGTATINVDLSELTDMTAGMVGTDEFIVLDAGEDRRKAANEIGLSIFNNDAGFSTTTGTVTSVATGGGLTGGTITGSGTISHADTSSQASLTALTGANVVSDIDVDTYGHVTSMSTRALAASDLSLGTSNDVQFDSFGVGTAASGTTGEIRATNDITAFYSDDRLKTRTGYIEDALEKVATLDAFYYEPNKLAQNFGYAVETRVGVSAQQVELVLPEAVKPAPIDDRFLTVQYEKLIPLLIAAINELQNKIELIERG